MSRDFESFCRDEYQRVYRAALALSGRAEVAREATQEAFGRAYSRWGWLSRQPWAAGWVMTTALNVCRSNFRKLRRTSRYPPPANEAWIEGPGPERADLVDALRRLPVRQRHAVILHYLGDLPVHAVAELMNTTDGTVKSYLWRARRALRSDLEVSDVPRRRIRNG
jgi:RNA polymerase sigma-70 factor (ECF subfamily)